MILRLTTIKVMLLVFDLFFQDGKMIHIAIDDNCSAVFHQETLVVEVIFKGRMFNWPDMVRTNVEKNTNVKGQTIYPFYQISLTGNFHNEVGSIIGNSLSHHGKKIQTFRRCQARFKEMLTIQCRIHGRQHSWSITLCQYMVSKVSCRCLTLGPCES